MLSLKDLKRYMDNLVQQIEALPKGDPERAELIRVLLKANDIAAEWASQDEMIAWAEHGMPDEAAPVWPDWIWKDEDNE